MNSFIVQPPDTIRTQDPIIFESLAPAAKTLLH